MADEIVGTIVAPDGTVATRPTLVLTDEEARLLRTYKKFLLKYHLREALYCQDCWDGSSTQDGCRAFVTADQILIECRCKMRFHQGAAY